MELFLYLVFLAIFPFYYFWISSRDLKLQYRKIKILEDLLVEARMCISLNDEERPKFDQEVRDRINRGELSEEEVSEEKEKFHQLQLKYISDRNGLIRRVQQTVKSEASWEMSDPIEGNTTESSRERNKRRDNTKKELEELLKIK